MKNNIGDWMATMRILPLLALGLLMFLPAPAPLAQDANTASGTAEAIDADIIKIDNLRIILWGVDAPDRNQTCTQGSELYPCYANAMQALTALVAPGAVICTLKGAPDPFHRRFGVCKAGDTDINAEMVKQGMAFAFTPQASDYAAAETAAKAAKIGLWQDGVAAEQPWLWRASRHTVLR